MDNISNRTCYLVGGIFLKKIMFSFSIFFITIVFGIIFFSLHDKKIEGQTQIQIVDFPKTEESIIIDKKEETSVGPTQTKVEVEEKNMIRILIKNNGFSGIYHNEVSFFCNEDVMLVSGDKKEQISANQIRTIKASDFVNESMTLLTSEHGYFTFESIKRKDKVSYPGMFELYLTKDGIILVNELSVEEYLKGVVPSEMPSSYPLEALKAQAVVARSYAYYHMKEYAYPEYRAHMDDSTSFQVYQNVLGTMQTDLCVDETKNKIMAENGNVKECMYFSTSPGILSQKESLFQKQIKKESAEDLESKEVWYRWECQYKISCQTLQSRILNSRYTDEKNKGFIDKSPKIKKIMISTRGKNGRVEELLVKTNVGDIYIRDQYEIRKILAVEGTLVKRKDGSIFRMGNILPSPYFYIESVDIIEKQVQLSLKGGGFGHGIGMSQNGAKYMALQGKTFEEILSFYYE